MILEIIPRNNYPQNISASKMEGYNGNQYSKNADSEMKIEILVPVAYSYTVVLSPF